VALPVLLNVLTDLADDALATLQKSLESAKGTCVIGQDQVLTDAQAVRLELKGGIVHVAPNGHLRSNE
jgi:hypothetical protein